MRIGLLFTIFLCSSLTIQAQSRRSGREASQELWRRMEDSLAFYADGVVNDSLPEERFLATRELILTLVRALRYNQSFHYPFLRLRNVSIQYPPDSTFRLFTWQLQVSASEYRYYGALQRRADTLVLFPLIDRSFNLLNPEREVLGPEKWMGCIYFGIQQFGSGPNVTYLAFGYDAHDGVSRRKWIEPIRFSAGRPVFGAPLFPPQGDSAVVPQRFILTYSAETSIRLNWDADLGLIVFDHLVPMIPKGGQEAITVSDGSYEAFRIHPERLEYIEMLPVVVPDEGMMRPRPVLGQDKMDILGRKIPEKKKKGGN